MTAYRAVAWKVGMSSAWVRKLVAGGVKGLDAEIKARLDALLIRELEAELARLQNELDVARQSGAHPCSEHMGAIEAHLAAAKALMNGGSAQ
jgi:hypothetical protein